MSKLVLLLILNAVLFLAAANWIIFEKEDHLKNGRRVLIECTRYDPRSFMQGDYMQLSYPICAKVEQRIGRDARGGGILVLGVDSNDVATLRRVHGGDEAVSLNSKEEIIVRYKIRWGRATLVRIAAEQFFFQEGMADEFQEKTRYAELRVNPDGRTLLVALCDEQRRRIGERKE